MKIFKTYEEYQDFIKSGGCEQSEIIIIPAKHVSGMAFYGMFGVYLFEKTDASHNTRVCKPLGMFFDRIESSRYATIYETEMIHN